ncbi:MAG: bacillithiol biosynthesis deacetylase BshB1 [Bacillota bacterium]|jgi:bacillithiol biosynthesis deacetylase BshB1
MRVADILAFAAHPDDAEIGAGGALARHARQGYEVVVVDLTLGELASNGSPEERRRESIEAARILGLAARECLRLPDRDLEPTAERVRTVAEAVRKWRPRLVLGPSTEDRHPDHAAAARLVREGVFSAGLPRYPARGEAHRVGRLVRYFVNAPGRPDFVVDVSEVYEVKLAALAAYSSQFGPGWHATPLNRGYLEWVELRDSWYGSLVGAARAEGFEWDGTLAVSDLVTQL